jgi:aryl-alcohol dehydrogenase-like predicted oxidoreductase
MTDTGHPSRRDFLRWGTAVSSAFVAGSLPRWAVAGEKGSDNAQPAPLPTRSWGKLKQPVPMLWLGTARVHREPNRSFDETVAQIRYGLDQGITLIDTARSYGSEKAIGEAIKGRRDKLTLLTKTTDRTYDGAMRELEQSLKDLGTDHVEIWKVHSIGYRHNGDEEVENLRRPDGVMKAMREMKEQGVVKHIGFTGHTDPEYMLKVMAWDQDGEFDTMLFTLSAATWKNQAGWEQKVLPAAQKKNYGLVGMKVFGAGSAIGDGPDKASAYELMKYVYDRGLPTVTLGLYTQAQVDEAVQAVKRISQEQSTDGEKKKSAQRLRERLPSRPLAFQQPGYVDGHGDTA